MHYSIRSRRRVRHNPAGMIATEHVTLIGILSTLSMAVSAYHGYKRNVNDSPILWGIVWGGLGAIFPVITPVIAIAEGYAQPLPPTVTVQLAP